MSPFDKLVPLLVGAIPKAVASLKPTKPICIVRIYFYDTHAPCTYLSLRTVSAECRDQVLVSKGRDAPFYIWGSGEECGDGNVDLPPDPPSSKTEKQIAGLFEQVYELLSDDEEENMVPYRELLREVARQLNALSWKKKICKVTDDFVVVPADGSMHFGGEDYEDMVESIPSDRLALLRSRGLLGPDESWDQLR
jgi:hypothetical protein